MFPPFVVYGQPVFQFTANLQVNGKLNFPSDTPTELWEAQALDLRLGDAFVLITPPSVCSTPRRLFVTIPIKTATPDLGAPCQVEVRARQASVDVAPKQAILYPTSGVFRFQGTVSHEGRRPDGAPNNLRVTVPAEYVRGMIYLGWDPTRVNVRLRRDNDAWVALPATHLRNQGHRGLPSTGLITIPNKPFVVGDAVEIELRRA